MAGWCVLVVLSAQQIDSCLTLDVRELVIQLPLVVTPREHHRVEAGQAFQVLDHNRVERHQLIALALGGGGERASTA